MGIKKARLTCSWGLTDWTLSLEIFANRATSQVELCCNPMPTYSLLVHFTDLFDHFLLSLKGCLSKTLLSPLFIWKGRWRSLFWGEGWRGRWNGEGAAFQIAFYSISQIFTEMPSVGALSSLVELPVRPHQHRLPHGPCLPLRFLDDSLAIV
jgi:hypothetical protein